MAARCSEALCVNTPGVCGSCGLHCSSPSCPKHKGKHALKDSTIVAVRYIMDGSEDLTRIDNIDVSSVSTVKLGILAELATALHMTQTLFAFKFRDGDDWVFPKDESLPPPRLRNNSILVRVIKLQQSVDLVYYEAKSRVCLVRKAWRADPSSFAVGSGFRIGQFYIITAKHVLLSSADIANGRTWNPGSLIVDAGFQDAWYECSIVAASPPDIDLVLLEIPSIRRGGLGASPAIQVTTHRPKTSDIVCACGYPKPRIPDSVFSAPLPPQPPAPSIFSGKISHVAPGRLELDLTGEPGFSGSGVLFESDG